MRARDDDDRTLINTFSVVNPKTDADGSVYLYVAKGEDEQWEVDLHVGGAFIGRAHISYCDATPEDWLDIDSSYGLATSHMRQGWGAALYFGAALAAEDLGYKGITSYEFNRQPDGKRIWEKLTAAGLVDRIVSEDGYVHDALMAAVVRRRGLAY